MHHDSERALMHCKVGECAGLRTMQFSWCTRMLWIHVHLAFLFHCSFASPPLCAYTFVASRSLFSFKNILGLLACQHVSHCTCHITPHRPQPHWAAGLRVRQVRWWTWWWTHDGCDEVCMTGATMHAWWTWQQCMVQWCNNNRHDKGPMMDAKMDAMTDTIL